MMLHTVVHPDPPVLPAKWVAMESPVMMDPQASKANLVNSLLHQPDHSHHAGPAPAAHRDHLVHLVPLAHQVPPVVPDPEEAMETLDVPAVMVLEAHPDHKAPPVALDRKDHLVVPVSVVSRVLLVPRDHPAVEDHPDLLADPAPTVCPAHRATLVLVETQDSLATTELPASPEPPVPPDPPERTPSTVLALVAALVARSRLVTIAPGRS